LHPPLKTLKLGVFQGSQAVYTTHWTCWLPNTNCGIATCPTRVIDTAGLAPARLRPCRPLRLDRNTARATGYLFESERLKRLVARDYYGSVVLINHQLTFPQAPIVIPDGRFSRVRLATLAFPNEPSRRNRGLSADSHAPLAPLVYSWLDTYYGNPAHLALSPGPDHSKCPLRPRAPLPAQVVNSHGVTSRATSEGVTPPSSLILAHAPDQMSSSDFGS
jgi:hypothetical protein